MCTYCKISVTGFTLTYSKKLFMPLKSGDILIVHCFIISILRYIKLCCIMKIIVLWVKALFLSLFYYRTIGTDKVKGKSVIKNMHIDDKHLWERCILKFWSYLNVIFHLSSGYIFSEANMVLSLYQISDIDKYLLSSNNKIKVLVVIQFYQWRKTDYL